MRFELQNQNGMSQSAAAQVRRLRTYVRRDVLSGVLRRWSWRGRRRVAHDVRRAELRAKRALGTNVGLDGSGVHAQVPAHALLLGEENSLPAVDVARIIGALLYPSTPLPEWPMVVAARDTADEAARERLQQIGLTHIATVGHYFGCRTTRDIDALVESLRDATGPIRVRRVHASDCFLVVSGHTAAARAALRGEQTIDVIVERTRTWTPLQEMLRAMSWLGGRVELYQPIDAPEVANESWPIVRQCTDRFALMHEFLVERKLLPPAVRTFMDVGASYGWFVAQMQRLGFDASGMDLDPLARELAAGVFGIRPEQYTVGDSAEELLRCTPTDVVSCFSVAHHFALGRGSVSVDEFRDRLAKATRRVLFFDTGEAHEAWIGRNLPEWTPEYIAKWLEAAGFDEVVALGIDRADKAPYEGNYGRTLFACVRNDANATTSDR
jgi:hypothetical protein